MEISNEGSGSMQQRKHIRLSAHNAKSLKIALRNKALSAISKKVRLRDISIGGVGLHIPDAQTIISEAIYMEFAILLPNEEICWLAGKVVYVNGDICGIQFREDFEQKKLSRHILQIERELRGYEKWGGGRGHTALSLDILEAVWGEAAAPEGKKILFVSSAGEPPSFFTGGYEIKVLRELGEWKKFYPDLVFVDSDNLTFGAYLQFQDMERHPLIRETPVFIFTNSDHEARYFTVKVSSGESFSCSMPKERFKKEIPGIMNLLLSKYGRRGRYI